MDKDIILIGNPIAGGGALRKIKKAVLILENKGFKVRLFLTAKKGDAQFFAERIASDTSLVHAPTLVIAAGGDGTYNEIANGLAYSNIPMAILPLGTTSVLAKELNIREDIESALQIALHGKRQTIHMGKITFTEDRGQKTEDRGQRTEDRVKSRPLSDPNCSLVTRYFILMAGIGFDAEAVLNVNERIKKISGKFAYILSGIRALINYNPSQILLRFDSNEISGYNAIIGKASCYGGNFKITPDASLKDPNFYVFLMHKKGRINLIREAFSIILKKTRIHSEDVSYFKSNKIEIDGDAPIQIDGDYIGRLPAKLEIVTDALKLIY
jgi:YegS/Rv2252/BmrU family lipid kinase